MHVWKDTSCLLKVKEVQKGCVWVLCSTMEMILTCALIRDIVAISWLLSSSGIYTPQTGGRFIVAFQSWGSNYKNFKENDIFARA